MPLLLAGSARFLDSHKCNIAKLMEKVSVQYAGEILLGMPQTQRVAVKNVGDELVGDELGITGGETTTENRS